MPEAVPAPSGMQKGPWSASVRSGTRGLSIGGVDAEALAERSGTPLLVMDVADVRERMRAVLASFPRAAYAVKALTAHAVLRMAFEEGLDLLCSSGGEVEACLRAGVPPGRIQLHGNAKTDDELRLAAEAGLGLVIADGVPELRRLDAIAREASRIQPVLLRVIPDVRVQTHEAIATGHAESKFGTPSSEAAGAARLAGSLPGIRLDGFHAHAGSQVLDGAPYVQVLDALVGLAVEAGIRPRVLDVGGGFGITYRDEEALDVGEVARVLHERLATLVAAHDLGEPALQVEPGRAIVGNAGCTLYRVIATKRVGEGLRLVAVDGGMSDNLRPMLYGAAHEVAVAGPPVEGERTPAALVGRHCESGDVLVPDASLPGELQPGDLLAVAATGAYTYPLASSYNRFGRPAVVGVERGRVTTWLRREDASDMDRLEVGAGRADPGAAPVPSGVEVRPARPGDVASFLDFWRAVIAEERYVRSESVRASAREYRRRFRRSWSRAEAQVVAARDGRVVGHVIVTRERHPVTAHVASIGIAVAADERGRGIGAALLAEAFRWAAWADVQKLLLSVYPHNTRAIALYRRFGFVDEGRLSRQSRKSYGYEDEILMAAWIGEDPE